MVRHHPSTTSRVLSPVSPVSRHHASRTRPSSPHPHVVVNVRAALVAIHVWPFRLAAVATPLHVRDEIDALELVSSLSPRGGHLAFRHGHQRERVSRGSIGRRVAPHVFGNTKLRHTTRRRRGKARRRPADPVAAHHASQRPQGEDARPPRRGRGRRAGARAQGTRHAARHRVHHSVGVQTSATASSRPLKWPGPRAIRT